MTKNKEDIIKDLQISKDKIFKTNKGINKTKEESTELILKILEWENEEIQLIMSLMLEEKASSNEISQILEIDEKRVLYEIEYIISKIESVLMKNKNTSEENKAELTYNEINFSKTHHKFDIKW